MALTVTLTPGYTFAEGETISEDKLNQLGNPTVDVEGSVSAASLADGSITSAKFAAGAVDANALGVAAVTADSLAPGAVNSGTVAPDAFFFGTATLSGSSIIFAANGVPSPTPGNYVQGQTYCFLPNFSCPSGGVTVNINGIGAVALKKNISQALGAGDFVSGQLVWIQFDGTNFQLTAPNVAGGGNVGVQCTFPTSTSVSCSGTQLILSNAAGGTFRVANFTVTAALGTSGLNGVDTGTIAASTWYYLHVITNGTTVSALISLSATAPTLPTGYFASAMATPFRTTASTTLTGFYTQGRKVYYPAPATSGTAQQPMLFTSQAPASATTYQSIAATVLSSVTTTALGLAGSTNGDVPFKTYVPPVATSFFGCMGAIAGSDAAIAVAADGSGTAEQTVVIPGLVSSGFFNRFSAGAQFTCPMSTSQSFYWKALTNTAIYRLVVIGYEF